MNTNPNKRPSTEEILADHIVDYNKTLSLKRTTSNPILLNTIKMPRDMLRLKSILPQER